MQTSITPTSLGVLGTANALSLRGVGPVDDSGRPNYLATYLDVSTAGDVTTTTTLYSRNIEMTVTQWDNWGKSPTDEAYQLACILTNLGLTAA